MSTSSIASSMVLDRSTSAPRPAPKISKFERMSAADFLKEQTLAYSTSKGKPVSGARGAQGTEGVRGKRRASPEEDLQRLVFDWIFLMELQYPILEFVMHVPNGGARSKGEAGKLKAMGVRRGIPDVVCPFASHGWTGFACELKAVRGRLTTEQSNYLEVAKTNGCLTGVCRTLDEFIALIKQFLGLAGPSQQ